MDTSRFWFNYRHVANVLSVYRSVKRLGIPDSQVAPSDAKAVCLRASSHFYANCIFTKNLCFDCLDFCDVILEF